MSTSLLCSTPTCRRLPSSSASTFSRPRRSPVSRPWSLPRDARRPRAPLRLRQQLPCPYRPRRWLRCRGHLRAHAPHPRPCLSAVAPRLRRLRLSALSRAASLLHPRRVPRHLLLPPQFVPAHVRATPPAGSRLFGGRHLCPTTRVHLSVPLPHCVAVRRRPVVHSARAVPAVMCRPRPLRLSLSPWSQPLARFQLPLSIPPGFQPSAIFQVWPPPYLEPHSASAL